MLKLILLPCVLLLIAGTAAMAEPPAVTKQIAQPESQQSASASGGTSTAQTALPEKKICKQLPTSGSRLPNRACLTTSEWKQVEEVLSH